MKKYLFICLSILVLTGCKNEMKCSLEKKEESYVLNQEVIMETDKNDYVISTEAKVVMEFETKEEAKKYYDIFNHVESSSKIELKDKKIIMTDSKDYSEIQKKDEIKEQLENTGYKCD